MKVARRDALGLAAAAGAGVLASGCDRLTRGLTHPAAPASIALPTGAVAPLARLLNRVGYGPRPGEIEALGRQGREAFIEEQLHPNDEEEPFLALRLRAIEALRSNGLELADLPEWHILAQLQQAALLRAVYSRHQLRERMVEFWTNHLNIYARKGQLTYFLPTDCEQVIRRHALGRFPDMIRASAHSPAMLGYLDNQVNRRIDKSGGGANENYARELLELHTLGVHGGYTQKDVQEVARCLTGWTIESRFWRQRGRFRFDPDFHDDGPKRVLGQDIAAGGGVKDGERVLDILCAHRSTAKFISEKLVRYFLGRDDAPWTNKLADVYMKSGGDIPSMLKPLLVSDDLLSGPAILKRPFDFMVSALRATAAETSGGRPLQEHLAKMGQPLHQWPMPDGYPQKTSAWTGTVLARWNFALALATGSIAGATVNLTDLLKGSNSDDASAASRSLVEVILGDRAESNSGLVELISTHIGAREATGAPGETIIAEAGALVLSTPAFQWR